MQVPQIEIVDSSLINPGDVIVAEAQGWGPYFYVLPTKIQNGGISYDVVELGPTSPRVNALGIPGLVKRVVTPKLVLG